MSSSPPADAGSVGLDKASAYRTVLEQIVAVLDGEGERTARMATVAALLAEAFPERVSWVGFYLVDPAREAELVVGPYQGRLGCLRIAFDRGVCGAAARTRTTQIVDDVHAFPGHIACDIRTNSEIVTPVLGPGGELIGVLDLDSPLHAAFDAQDATGLEAIVQAVFGR